MDNLEIHRYDACRMEQYRPKTDQKGAQPAATTPARHPVEITRPRRDPARHPHRIGKWPSRDPLGEASFLRFYLQGDKTRSVQDLLRDSLIPPFLFLANNPISFSDHLGLRLNEADCQKYLAGSIADLKSWVAQQALGEFKDMLVYTAGGAVVVALGVATGKPILIVAGVVGAAYGDISSFFSAGTDIKEFRDKAKLIQKMYENCLNACERGDQKPN